MRSGAGSAPDRIAPASPAGGAPQAARAAAAAARTGRRGSRRSGASFGAKAGSRHSPRARAAAVRTIQTRSRRPLAMVSRTWAPRGPVEVKRRRRPGTRRAIRRLQGSGRQADGSSRTIRPAAEYARARAIQSPRSVRRKISGSPAGPRAARRSSVSSRGLVSTTGRAGEDTGWDAITRPSAPPETNGAGRRRAPAPENRSVALSIPLLGRAEDELAQLEEDVGVGLDAHERLNALVAAVGRDRDVGRGVDGLVPPDRLAAQEEAEVVLGSRYGLARVALAGRARS